MTTFTQPSAGEVDALLQKVAGTKPVQQKVRCEGPNGAVAYANNPDWPPHRKGECTAEDYGVWIHEDVMPQLVAYIRQLEKVKADALEIAQCDGQVDGDHHKAWAIDQMVRALTGCPLVEATAKDYRGEPYTYKTMGESAEYKAFVTAAKAGEDGPESYEWDTGIAP